MNQVSDKNGEVRTKILSHQGVVMEKRPTAITANALQKSYKKVHVLRDVSFIVEKLRCLALTVPVKPRRSIF